MSGFREPAFAGLFYPSDPKELDNTITIYLKEQEQFPEVFSHGIIAPHAGYMYSGATAGAVYSRLAPDAYKTIIILSPSHREYFDECSIFPGHGYLTPLGEIKTNLFLRDRLPEIAPDVLCLSEAGHRKEHGIEVQLPFIQKMFPKADIVPIVMGNQSPELIDTLSDVLAEVFTEDMLIVASSDLSHFHTAAVALKKDSRFAAVFEEANSSTMMNELHYERIEACGGGLVVTMLKTLNKFHKQYGKSVHLTNSGAVSGDTKEVVGYYSGYLVH